MLLQSQKRLAKKLSKAGVQKTDIKKVLDSGYYYWDQIANGERAYVGDSFYGSKFHIGLIPFPNFVSSIIAPGSYPHANIRSYKIRSLKDALDILAGNKWFAANRMSFRGQIQEYFTRRRYPNPFEVLPDGRERLVLPGYWRKYNKDWNKRFDAPEYRSIFKSIYGDFITFYGLPDPNTMAQYNLNKYGIHTTSDMADFEEDFNKEYYRRWKNIKINPCDDLPVVEQHYGFDTPLLDVTFDIKVSLFFATHKYVVRNGLAYYELIPKGQHQGVVYAFVFHDPCVVPTYDQIERLPAFEHIPPTRPGCQKCALRLFDRLSINEAATDIDTIFYLDPEFDMAGISTFEELFPSTKDDKFYEVLIEVKKKFGSGYPLDKIAIYGDLQ